MVIATKIKPDENLTAENFSIYGRNNEQILDTALSEESYYTYHSILKYNNDILITFVTGLSNTRHALALQFPHPRWTNQHGSGSSDLGFDSMLITRHVTRHTLVQKWRVENYSALEKFPWRSRNHEIFSTKVFRKINIFFNQKSPDYDMTRIQITALVYT